MTRRGTLVAIAGLVLAVGLAGYAQTQRARRRPGAAVPGPIAGVAGPGRVGMESTYRLQVARPDRERERPAAEERNLQGALRVLETLRPLPAERLANFRWVAAPEYRLEVTGWGHIIEEATPRPDGLHIRVAAVPSVTRGDGGVVLVGNRFIEEYLWAGGTLHLIRAYPDPVGPTAPRLFSM